MHDYGLLDGVTPRRRDDSAEVIGPSHRTDEPLSVLTTTSAAAGVSFR
jgi:hypothetical protein